MKKFTTILCLALISLSCADLKQNGEKSEEATVVNPISTETQIATFFTFQKENAEQAMNYYIELFDDSKIVDLKRWGKEGPGKEGTIMHATFNLNGQPFMCSDSPPIHEWGFTPAVSNFIECKDESQLTHLYTQLSANGKVMMPLNNYGFSQKFGFVEDQFGVSWQLNLQ